MSPTRSLPLSTELATEPTEHEDEWEVVGADDVRATSDPFPPSERELDRERLLLEAGQLYGRDTERERAALLDGSHPVARLKPRAR